ALTEYERALQLLFTIERAALTPVEERSWLSEVAHNELNRASALTFLDRPEEAEAALLRASAYFLQAEERMNHGRAQTNLGRLYLRWGQYANALTAFDQALNDLLGERAAELLVAALTVNVSESDQAMGGEHAPALAQLRQADELLLEQAMAYLAMNLLPEAQQRLAICEVLFRTAVQPYELGQSLYTWGLFDLRAGELSRAATHLAEAALQFAQLSNGFWQNRTALAQAALLYAAGDLNGAVSAVEQLFAAIPSDWAEPTDERLQWDLGGLVELHLLRLRCGIRLGQLTEVPLWAEQIAMLLGFSFVTLQNAATLSDRSVAATTAPVEPVALPHYTQRFYHLLGQWAREQGASLEARYYFLRAISLLEATRALLPVEEIR
ncbi:MAG: tetratricopeptide repeat protein, partial [Caldilineaceae bacterium]|nr:tetratricopeptide repeat protein [Caldilineaceae bacterium]